MSKRDELIAKYAEDLKTKCKMEPDMDLLTKVTNPETLRTWTTCPGIGGLGDLEAPLRRG